MHSVGPYATFIQVPGLFMPQLQKIVKLPGSSIRIIRSEVEYLAFHPLSNVSLEPE